MPGAYGALARHYDALMAHVDYGRWADYIVPFLGGARLALDLACGTGRLTQLLCERGFDMIGVDRSADMLSVALARECGALFLRQDMAELDLYGTVQAAVCTLDGLNYVTSPEKLGKVLSRVALFLEPGGVFVFDMHSPDALMARDGRSYSSDCADAFCIWRCDWRPPLCRQHMTLFEKQGALWRRYEEEHTERAYGEEEMRALLADAGFDRVDCYGDFTQNPPGTETERLFYVAKRRAPS